MPIQNSVIFTKIGKLCVTLEIHDDRYSEPTQRFKVECFTKKS